MRRVLSNHMFMEAGKSVKAMEAALGMLQWRTNAEHFLPVSKGSVACVKWGYKQHRKK